MRKILIGLGNPGPEYENTYHNAGALAIEKIADTLSLEAGKTSKKASPLFSFREIGMPNGDCFIFVRPKTFMNKSGLAVKSALKYFSAQPSEIVVFHDDSDLPLGTARISESPNFAGHRGLISVKNETGVSDFKRVRIGIRNPEEKVRKKAEEFVLKNISKAKMSLLLGESLGASWPKVLGMS